VTNQAWHALAILALALCAPRSVRAEDEPPEDVRRRPLAVNAHAGLGAPLGRVGLAVELTAPRAFSIEVGAGLGLSGQQIAVSPRLRVFERQSVAASVGVGFSFGRFERRRPFFGVDRAATIYRRSAWSNLEASLEGRARSGFQIRGYVGLGVMLHGDLEECTVDGERMPCDGTDRGVLAAYAGLSVGYAFPL
jgi:hypothetical protein